MAYRIESEDLKFGGTIFVDLLTITAVGEHMLAEGVEAGDIVELMAYAPQKPGEANIRVFGDVKWTFTRL